MEIVSVLISDSCDPQCAEMLTKAGCEVTVKIDHTPEELIGNIKNFDALVVRDATKVTAELINAAPKLKVIARAGTGVDNIDYEAATKNGVLVINAPEVNTVSAAEMTCALILSLSRDIAAACASLKAGRWDRENFMSNELEGKTLGILGLGKIGRAVATRMKSFGMRIIGHDPFIPKEVFANLGIESMGFDELLPLCDYITVHTPLTRETENAIHATTLALCKKGVKIVNCARGGIVHEKDLLAALESGQVSGAGFDVFEEEPPKNTAFITHPKVICTPHLGANTEEAQARAAIQIAEQFVALSKGQTIGGAVNCPLLPLTRRPQNRPYIHLAIDLGKVAGALVNGSSEIAITVELGGKGLNNMARLFVETATIGVLKALGERPNIFNVNSVAEKRNVFSYYNAQGSFCTDYKDCCIKVTAKGDSVKVVHRLEGTAGDESILRAIDGVPLKAGLALTGTLIVAIGPADSLPAVLQAVSALGKVESVVHSGTKYFISADVCTKSNAAPSPLTKWATLVF